MKRILIAGNGKSGSWKIRGEQLGAAIGATIEPHARPTKRFDIGVIVKRLETPTVNAMRAQRIPIVWDIVDAWPQPHGNTWDRGACMDWLRGQIKSLKPHAVVAATCAMANDVKLSGFTGPVLALPHHARPGQPINPIRRAVATVGYEGGVQYLGKWHHILQAECKARGWRFVTNPAALAELDIVIAMREAQGYAARMWKSNVKLANAQGTGTPFIGCREAGYLETDETAAAEWADTKGELRGSFDRLDALSIRRDVSAELQAARITIEVVAARYREWLESL